MSSDSPHQPTSKLGRRLLDSARDQAPPEASLQRALELVDSAPASATVQLHGHGTGSRWILWALPAAAAVFGVLAFAALRSSSESPSVVAEPAPKASVAADLAPAATATATAVAVAPPAPTASGSASAAVSARPAPKAVAARGKKGPAPAKAKATSKPGKASAGKCGCKADDLMCHMRCSQSK